MSKKSNSHISYFVYVVLLFQLVFLYFIKHLNQDLPVSDFSIWKIGNLLNLFLYAGILVGLYLTHKKDNSLLSTKFIISFLTISWILLIASFSSTLVDFFPSGTYVFAQPADRVLTGALFVIFFLSLLYFLIYIWNTILIKAKPKFFKVIALTATMMLTFFISILIYIDNVGYTSDRWAITKNDKNIGVVLGAAVWTGNIPSPTLSARVDKAIELLENGSVGKIVLTGGKAPGELAESEVAYEYAKAKGVDSSFIIIEVATSSTTDQIRWIKKNIMLDTSSGRIILISDAYHLPRAIELSKYFNLDVKVAESVHKLNFNDVIYNKVRESIALFIFWNFAL